MARSPLDLLTRLTTKPERLVCGLMSGTSVDAVDVALVRIRGGGPGSHVELLHYAETLYPEEIQQRIFANAEVSTSNVDDICLLHSAVAHVYADAVSQLCNEAGVALQDIDLIGMHGQTLRHLPDKIGIGRHAVRSTLQIGNGATLASLLGVPVVYDFRAADMAAGGQGAPLVPYVDYLLFRSDVEHRLLLNIGGIANLTWLPSQGGPEDVIAFDTGPGNMIVDALMRRFHGREYDENGAVARSGNINPDLITWMMRNEFFTLEPPKTTGRERFGSPFIQQLLQIVRDLGITSTENIITTASECTVRSITDQAKRLLPHEPRFKLFISGGGARNLYFLDGLKYAFPAAHFGNTTDLGIPGDAKEAISFAILANEWLEGNSTNLPAVTGASRPMVLGAFASGL